MVAVAENPNLATTGEGDDVAGNDVVGNDVDIGMMMARTIHK
jgi:hypothetical protein